MKHKLIYLFAILAALVIALFFSRHAIIGHMLKISINKKTDKTITLDIGNVDYDVFNSTVSFTNSEFLFSNTYLNKTKTIELSELKFSKIEIYKLSVFRLLFYREVIAQKIIIDAPALWFSEKHKTKAFKEKPKEIIKSLHENHDILKSLVVIVDEFIITNGKIDLNSIIDGEKQNGSVEFTVSLKNINTSKKLSPNENRLLYAEDHFVKLSNFNYSLINGDYFLFDSLVFDSKLNNLIANNIRISSNNVFKHSKINPVNAQIGEAKITGVDIKLIKDFSDVNIDSIALIDAFVQLTKNDSVVIKADTAAGKKNIFSEIHEISINTFVLNNINLIYDSNDGDTIAELKNLNFSLNNIVLDSVSIAQKKPNINYSSITLSSDKVKIIEKELGLNIKFNNFAFAENTGDFSVDGLQIYDYKNKDFIDARFDKVNVSGIYAESLIDDSLLKIGLTFVKPVVNVKLHANLNKKSKRKKTKFKNLQISNIEIEKGNINIVDKDKFEVNISGLDFNSGIIQLFDFAKFHELNSASFLVSTSVVKLNLPNKNILLNIGSLAVADNSFTINKLSTNIVESGINSKVFVGRIMFDGYNISNIINDSIIDINHFTIVNPKITGSFKKELKKNKRSGLKHSFAWDININDFEIVKGNIDFDIYNKNEVIKLNTDIDVVFDKISIEKGTDTTWVNKLIWKIDLLKPAVNYNNYFVTCQSVNLNNSSELLEIQSINVLDNNIGSDTSAFDINSLKIEGISLQGVKYNAIINNQTPIVNTILITKPYFDISIYAKNYHARMPKHKLNKSMLPFDVDDIEIKNLSFNVKNIDSTSVTHISLGNLGFKYNMLVASNAVDAFGYLNVSDFNFSDTAKNIFGKIEKVGFDKIENQIYFTNVTGGNIKKLSLDGDYLQYNSSGFSINDVQITQTAPHNINIRSIDIDDFDIDMQKNNTDSSVSKTSAKKKIALPNFLQSLNIDTIFGCNINVTHVAIADTSQKKTELQNLDLLVNTIKIDSSTISSDSVVFVKEVVLNFNDNRFVSKNKLYATSIGSVSYNFYKNELVIDSLLMKPRYAAAEFFKKAVYQTGKMNIATSQIVCSNIRFQEIIKHGAIHIGSVDVYGLKMFIFRNKKYEMDPNKYVKMPQESLLELSQVLTIDSLKTHDSYIQYKQLSKKSVVPGAIFLDEVYLSLFNINNNLKVIDKTSAMTADFKGKIEGESKINLKVAFPILSPTHDFWVTGNVEKIDFTKLNSMTQNLVGVTLKSGTGELNIPLITGNRISSKGSIEFKYKKLKIELYDRDKAQNATGLGGNMANLLLNDIFIKSNNPGFLGKTRDGDVYFTRNTQKSIVYYTWKSILSGIMSTMGYNSKEQRQEKRAWRKRR